VIKVRKRWLAVLVVLGIPVIAAGAVAGIAYANMPRAQFDDDAFAGGEPVAASGPVNHQQKQDSD
jgi:hypothetical protein